MTLEQFADLMGGLGYKAEKGERVKVKPAPETPAEEGAPPADAAEAPVEAIEPDAPSEAEDPADAAAKPDAPAENDAPAEAPEMEVFYTFTWGGNRGARKDTRPHGGKPRGKPKGKPRREPQGTKKYQARPPKKEKQIDPDNPFAAALMGLKDKK